MTATGAPRLFVPGYYSGFSNNRMSLDVAVVLAHLTGRVLAPYRFRMPRRHAVPADGIVVPMIVPELFDLPVPWTDEFVLKTWVSTPDAVRVEWAPIYDSVVCVDEVPPPGDDRFADFRNGRSHVHVIDRAVAAGRDLLIDTQGLANYSTAFFLDEARRREVVELMRRMRPKQAYLDAAATIGRELGAYNAIHIRRGDFVGNELAHRKISRAASIQGREIVANLADRMSRDDPLVICTDGAADEEIFGPIQQHFRAAVFLDRLLHEDRVLRDVVAGLPREGEAVDALIAQLVAAGAGSFAGTMFSTFTGLIHRMRGFENPHAPVLYCYDDFLSPLVHFERGEFVVVDDGPYSWSRVRYPVSPDAYSWMREWPEAWGGEQPAVDETGPADVTELTADRATLTGANLRRVDDVGGRPVLIDWTDPADHPSWAVDVGAGTYAVEIRYACPAESAGSRYTVEVGPGEALTARVHDTGAWTTPSPWLPLGRVELDGTRSTLTVRARELTGLAVMNLVALRLRRLTTLR